MAVRTSDRVWSACSFARAMFIWQIIGVVATILIFAAFGGAIFAGLQNSGG